LKRPAGVPEVLLFGTSGQIGEAACRRLLGAGWQVMAVSRQPRADRPGVRWLQGDLASNIALAGSADLLLSCGPLDLFAQWYERAEPSCPRVVAFGSTSASVKLASPDAAERDLARRLADAEARLLARSSQLGAALTVLRPTLVYGAGRDQTLSRIARLARRASLFALPRGASGLRQPVHVDDLAAAAMAVIDVPATHGQAYALPGGETLPYREMVARTLASLRPPPRLLELPAPLFALALQAARLAGRMPGAGAAMVARMGEDLVFDPGPAQRDFGYAPRRFDPQASMFEPGPLAGR